jgi:hypothetical protein
MAGIYILCVVGGLFLIGSICILLDIIYNSQEEVYYNPHEEEPISSLKGVIEEYSVITDDYDF